MHEYTRNFLLKQKGYVSSNKLDHFNFIKNKTKLIVIINYRIFYSMDNFRILIFLPDNKIQEFLELLELLELVSLFKLVKNLRFDSSVKI